MTGNELGKSILPNSFATKLAERCNALSCLEASEAMQRTFMSRS